MGVPNYYAVELADYGVKAEMTSGVRSGMFRFTYPESDNAFIMIDMNHTLWQSCEWSNLRMINDSTITGYKLVKGWGPERHVYFTATFSKKLTGLRFVQDKSRLFITLPDSAALTKPGKESDGLYLL